MNSTIAESKALINPESFELSVTDVENQVVKIQNLMKSIMHKDEHYGVIPGTKKPSLYKAGAEKLCFAFRLVPKFEIQRTELPSGHREYEVICSLYHQGTGAFIGQGVGLASSMESKYRYRNDYEEENTGKPVPKKYWDLKKDEKYDEAKKLLGGSGFGPKKIDGIWVIVKRDNSDRKVENPDIADTYNTILKMAKKRAHVDATITACAASDIFTQDMEDFRQENNPQSSMDEGVETVTGIVEDDPGNGKKTTSPKPAKKEPAKLDAKAKESNAKLHRQLVDLIKEMHKSLFIDDKEQAKYLTRATSYRNDAGKLMDAIKKLKAQFQDAQKNREDLDKAAGEGFVANEL
jgi:hypothetical protein